MNLTFNEKHFNILFLRLARSNNFKMGSSYLALITKPWQTLFIIPFTSLLWFGLGLRMHWYMVL